MSEIEREKRPDLMADVLLCSAAELEYTNAFCWYAERRPDAALEFESEFDHSIREISSNHTRFPKCDDRHRFFLMRKYPFQIIYRVQNDRLIVIAIAHTSREPNYWANR